MPDDPYALLGVDRGASREEIAEAYRALAQIYHPDRYAEAPARVQAEANARMQALNAAYASVRTGNSRPAQGTGYDEQPPPPPRRPKPAAPTLVHYVDGAKGYHHGDVAPLGFGSDGHDMQPLPDAKRCSKLDAELLQWFDLQRRNASVPAKQLYESWTAAEQASYAAKMGCSQVPRDKANAFALSCPECRP